MDEAGEPLSRMNVIAARVMAGSDVAQRVGHEPATTDDLGRYRIYGLEPGEYVVAVEGRSVPVTRAQQPGVRVPLSEQELMAFLTTFHPSALVEPAAQRIQLAPGRDAVGIDIAAVRARRFRVSGVVLDSQGVPLAVGERGPQPRRQASAATSHGFTSDAVGRFTVAAVEPGEYTLVVGGGTWTSPVGSTGRPETRRVADDRCHGRSTTSWSSRSRGSACRDAWCWPMLRRRRLPDCGLRSAAETVR